MAKRHLVIVTGLGDRKWLHILVKPIWAILGFKTYVFKYGWKNDKIENYVLQQRLADFIDNIQSNCVYIIGVSAGGTVAINILASRPLKIAKVVTICTPYSPIPCMDNQLANASINQLQLTLQTISKDTKNKIIAIYSCHDQIVPVQYGKPANIKTKQLKTVGHGLSIAFSLTILSRYIKDFFVE